jgi:hypothetical protein
MISADQIRSLIAVYESNGWLLRRVVVRSSHLASIRDLLALQAPDAELAAGNVNAAWFSRKPQGKPVAWELRSLEATPYAILEFLDETAPDFAERLKAIEDRLREKCGGDLA